MDRRRPPCRGHSARRAPLRSDGPPGLSGAVAPNPSGAYAAGSGRAMRVAIHQPHYLPWLGYLHRMARADLFIVLDHVQFERANYQNRAAVRVNGAAHWLTVPVLQRSRSERISDKRIDNSRDWAALHYETLRRAYTAAGYFSSYATQLQRFYRQR